MRSLSSLSADRERPLRPLTSLVHEDRPAEFHHRCSVLLEAGRLDSYHTHCRTRLRFARAQNLRLRIDRIAFENRRRNLHFLPAGEVAYLNAPGRESFERPYGLAWLLQLAAELRESPTPNAAALSSALKPLEAAVVAQLKAWLPKLAYPIRDGEHPQTAFAFGLILDYARGTDPAFAAIVAGKVREFHLNDRDCPINYEPSGQDFLSPCIAEADVMRRVLPPNEFAAWLTAFLPRLPTTSSGAWLPIGVVTDKTDGKLAHLDGLNLSRAWMLEGIAAGLPSGDPRRRALIAAAGTHAASGLAAVTGEHYAGGHWLGSFATYLTTRRGIGK